MHDKVRERLRPLVLGLGALLFLQVDAARAAEACPDPIILVHGTVAKGQENWSWSYDPALRDLGCDVTVFDMPRRSLGDIRAATEVLAGVVDDVLTRTGAEKVDLIGHSQGGLEPRWFIANEWTIRGEIRRGADVVDDYIALASPNHGTIVANAAVETFCQTAACWQMRYDASPLSSGSKLLTELNRADETPGTVSYTNVHSATDELVQPVGTAELSGTCSPDATGCSEEAPVSNILLQDLCPGRPVEHAWMAGDALAFELTKDALAHPGPADPGRLPTIPALGVPVACLEVTYEEGGLDRFPEGSLLAPVDILQTAASTPMYEEEPTCCSECDTETCLDTGS